MFSKGLFALEGRDHVEARPADASSFVFSLLEGEWDLEREIQNFGYLKGRSTFDPFDSETLHYSESGHLELISGFEGNVFREYYYQLAEDHILVSFVDALPGAKPFIRLSLQNREDTHWAKDVHHCGSDMYECTYIITSPDVFSTLIEVEGPSKSYVIKSIYSRIGE